MMRVLTIVTIVVCIVGTHAFSCGDTDPRIEFYREIDTLIDKINTMDARRHTVVVDTMSIVAKIIPASIDLVKNVDNSEELVSGIIGILPAVMTAAKEMTMPRSFDVTGAINAISITIQNLQSHRLHHDRLARQEACAIRCNKCKHFNDTDMAECVTDGLVEIPDNYKPRR